VSSLRLTVDGEIVEGVEKFVYLGSKQTSDGYCRPEIMRRIGLAFAVMSSLRKVWNNRHLCVDTKVHVYRALVQSVLLYGSETRTLLASDIKKLEAFHLWCQRQIRCVSWRGHITNEAICKQTKLASLTELKSRRCTSLFGHIARLDAAVPAREVLWLQTNISTERNLSTSWKRLPGRPRKTWTSQIPDDTGMSSRAFWDASIRRGHGRGMLRSLKTMR